MVALLPEYVLPFTIHLLAHDPDLTSHTDTETLKNIREYVKHYITVKFNLNIGECVCNDSAI